MVVLPAAPRGMVMVDASTGFGMLFESAVG